MTNPLYEPLKQLLQMVEELDLSEGYCCCGSKMEDHDIGSGHSPVDAGWYYRQPILDKAKKALADEDNSQR